MRWGPSRRVLEWQETLGGDLGVAWKEAKRWSRAPAPSPSLLFFDEFNFRRILKCAANNRGRRSGVVLGLALVPTSFSLLD